MEALEIQLPYRTLANSQVNQMVEDNSLQDHELSAILQKHSSLFSPELRLLTGVKVHLHLKADATPSHEA